MLHVGTVKHQHFEKMASSCAKGCLELIRTRYVVVFVIIFVVVIVVVLIVVIIDFISCVFFKN